MIELPRGDDHDLPITGLKDGNGNPDTFLAGDVATFTAKLRADDPDPPLLSKSSTTGGITLDLGTDHGTIHFGPADYTNLALDRALPFVWDLEHVRGGKVHTLDSGDGLLTPDVTGNEATEPSALGGTTCTPWATFDDLLDPCREGVDPEEMTIALQIASDVLYELCPRKYRGTCVDEVRPLAKWRPQRPAGWWASSLMGNTSRYGWCSCNRAPDYGCAAIPQIVLPGFPVDPASITVTLDGANFTDFELLDRRRLVRTDGNGFPCCQDLLLATTEANTWSVRYAYGVDPPMGGRRAAAILGCELYRVWHPDSVECKLPQRVTNVVRQGVTVAFNDLAALFVDGRVGIPYVDLWLSSQRLGERQRASLIVPGRSRTVTRTR